jgi:hypothetical protein
VEQAALIDRRQVRVLVHLCVSTAGVSEPSSGLSYDVVDLEQLQTSRFFFQLCTPFHQDFIPAPFRLLVAAFIHNLLDDHFPFLRPHRLFLFDFGRIDGSHD